MEQILHGSARTTAAVRRAIQHSQESLNQLAQRYAVNPKTMAKWKKRSFVHDTPMGPAPRSTVLTPEQEAICVAFRRHTLLALDDCLYVCPAKQHPGPDPILFAPLLSAPRHLPSAGTKEALNKAEF